MLIDENGFITHMTVLLMGCAFTGKTELISSFVSQRSGASCYSNATTGSASPSPTPSTPKSAPARPSTQSSSSPGPNLSRKGSLGGGSILSQEVFLGPYEPTIEDAMTIQFVMPPNQRYKAPYVQPPPPPPSLATQDLLGQNSLNGAGGGGGTNLNRQGSISSSTTMAAASYSGQGRRPSNASILSFFSPNSTTNTLHASNAADGYVTPNSSPTSSPSLRPVQDPLSPTYDPDYIDEETRQNRQRVVLTVLEVGGHACYASLWSSAARAADAVMLVYDVGEKRSFDALWSLVKIVSEAKRATPREIPFLLVGTMVDTIGRTRPRQVSHQTALSFSRILHIPHAETSARASKSVTHCFRTMIEVAQEKVMEEINGGSGRGGLGMFELGREDEEVGGIMGQVLKDATMGRRVSEGVIRHTPLSPPEPVTPTPSLPSGTNQSQHLHPGTPPIPLRKSSLASSSSSPTTPRRPSFGSATSVGSAVSSDTVVSTDAPGRGSRSDPGPPRPGSLRHKRDLAYISWRMVVEERDRGVVEPINVVEVRTGLKAVKAPGLQIKIPNRGDAIERFFVVDESSLNSRVIDPKGTGRRESRNGMHDRNNIGTSAEKVKHMSMTSSSLSDDSKIDPSPTPTPPPSLNLPSPTLPTPSPKRSNSPSSRSHPSRSRPQSIILDALSNSASRPISFITNATPPNVLLELTTADESFFPDLENASDDAESPSQHQPAPSTSGGLATSTEPAVPIQTKSILKPSVPILFPRFSPSPSATSNLSRTSPSPSPATNPPRFSPHSPAASQPRASSSPTKLPRVSPSPAVTTKIPRPYPSSSPVAGMKTSPSVDSVRTPVGERASTPYRARREGIPLPVPVEKKETEDSSGKEKRKKSAKRKSLVEARKSLVDMMNELESFRSGKQSLMSPTSPYPADRLEPAWKIEADAETEFLSQTAAQVEAEQVLEGTGSVSPPFRSAREDAKWRKSLTGASSGEKSKKTGMAVLKTGQILRDLDMTIVEMEADGHFVSGQVDTTMMFPKSESISHRPIRATPSATWKQGKVPASSSKLPMARIRTPSGDSPTSLGSFQKEAEVDVVMAPRSMSAASVLPSMTTLVSVPVSYFKTMEEKQVECPSGSQTPAAAGAAIPQAKSALESPDAKNQRLEDLRGMLGHLSEEELLEVVKRVMMDRQKK
ncbi:hypothetical protein HDU97_000855 [Phlyctochytrium planicorne]|nr:hypothetical protein HDU97_000855 [Phlyctochytrium planicorne]